jgi:hypothetical protein
MQRWQGAALATVLCTGCLDSLVDDEPGYSRYVQPADASVPSAYDDKLLNRKIDLNDAESPPTVPLKNGFAAGQAIRYWDFGVAKRAAAPAYGLASCADGKVIPVPVSEHPVIVDNIPGDNDYSSFRSFQWACKTPKYSGEIIDSLDAFNDAIDLGLITDPTGTPATTWANNPIVGKDVAMAFSAMLNKPPLPAYYRGTKVLFHDLQQQEGLFTIDPMAGIKTGNVYELVKPGQMTPARVIFSTPYLNPDGSGTRNPNYTPNWIVVTLQLKAPIVAAGTDPITAATAFDVLIDSLTNADDLVTVGMNNAVTVKNTMVVNSATVTTNRVNRAFFVKDYTP